MLKDLLKPNLSGVIVGTAAGNTSARIGSYYAGPGNKFWRILYEVGITPRALLPTEYEKLSNYGLGLTDLVKTTSGMDKTLLDTDYDIQGFVEKIKRFQPVAAHPGAWGC